MNECINPFINQVSKEFAYAESASLYLSLSLLGVERVRVGGARKVSLREACLFWRQKRGYQAFLRGT
jgi:hypothetical protein